MASYARRYAQRKEMKKFILLVLFLVVSPAVYSEEKLCSEYKPVGWGQMKESEFSKEAVIKRLKQVEQLLNGEIQVAHEFNIQSEIIIKGGLLRNSVEAGKKYNKNAYWYYLKKYCNFLNEEAHIVH